ncbi:glycoside hydrolase 5 family protein [Sphingomonas sp. XXL09]|uniref:glycoside hydrolase 5 family protein n=1 Tax=Sphingomonas sp. XXL09 TaxID=3457787 RepID=UPI00406BC589
MEFTRRTAITAGSALLAITAAAPILPAAAPDRFVRRDGMQLMRGGARYRYAGANMWYAAYLGAATPTGDPDRLRRELDTLASLGVGNIRLLASAELSPLTNSLRPAFRDRGTQYNQALLRGLDVALAEMGRRGMTAVLYLTNFWEWSGGMMTYLSWVNGGHFINNNDPVHPWPEFADRASAFYADARAVALYNDYVAAVVGRTNSVTGVAYRDDPTIMAWQLANEPRPGGGVAVARANMPAFDDWVQRTARLIKGIDRHHLVSTGSEGLKGCIEEDACVLAEHRVPEIDYLTTHVWPLNWNWVDDKDLAGTWQAGAAKARAYVDAHVALARRLGKPLVIEEFGFPRDAGYDPGTPTTWKDRFYALIYEAALAGGSAGGPVAGTNFWAWGGEGRSPRVDHRFTPSPRSYVGDPPHEPQGWYSVFDVDRSTRAVIRDHAAAIARG